MTSWKLVLIWFALIAWRLGSASILVMQGKESELIDEPNWAFWVGYCYLWVSLQYPNKARNEDGVGDGLYVLAWVFLVALIGLGLRFLVWVLLQLLFNIHIRTFWGEVFAVIFATICLYIPSWLRRNTITTQDLV